MSLAELNLLAEHHRDRINEERYQVWIAGATSRAEKPNEVLDEVLIKSRPQKRSIEECERMAKAKDIPDVL